MKQIFVCILVFTALLTISCYADAQRYVDVLADTNTTLSNGSPFAIDEGDIYPFLGYNLSHKFVQLKVGPYTFWTKSKNVEFIYGEDIATAAAEYAASLARYLPEIKPILTPFERERLQDSEMEDSSYYKQKYEQAMAQLNMTKDEFARWRSLGDAAKCSLNQRLDTQAKSFAEELKELAVKYQHDEIYGQSIQDYNIVLGRLALKAGNYEEAEKCLFAAGNSPGSPVMDSFGPNMSLAKALLVENRSEAVIEYFKLCQKFWKMDGHKLYKWTRDIKNNRIPDFSSNLYY